MALLREPGRWRVALVPLLLGSCLWESNPDFGITGDGVPGSGTGDESSTTAGASTNATANDGDEATTGDVEPLDYGDGRDGPFEADGDSIVNEYARLLVHVEAGDTVVELDRSIASAEDDLFLWGRPRRGTDHRGGGADRRAGTPGRVIARRRWWGRWWWWRSPALQRLGRVLEGPREWRDRRRL